MILDKRPQKPKSKLRLTPGDLPDLSRNGNVDVAKEPEKSQFKSRQDFKIGLYLPTLS